MRRGKQPRSSRVKALARVRLERRIRAQLPQLNQQHGCNNPRCTQCRQRALEAARAQDRTRRF